MRPGKVKLEGKRAFFSGPMDVTFGTVNKGGKTM